MLIDIFYHVAPSLCSACLEIHEKYMFLAMHVYANQGKSM